MSDEGQRADFANKNPEGETRPAAVTLALGDKIPSFSPSARESASKRRERTAACSGDTLTPGGEIPSQERAIATRARAVTAQVAQDPEGGAEPLTWPAEPPSWWPEGAVYAPGMARRIGIPFTPPVTRASGAHLEPVGPHELPEFLRRQGVTSLATHAQPIASDREPSEGTQADQSSGFVPRELRGARAVTPPITQAPPVAASVTLAVTPGSICPTCHRRVPARLSDAERQRAYRERRREQGKPIVP
jgi:hypothetical protein